MKSFTKKSAWSLMRQMGTIGFAVYSGLVYAADNDGVVQQSTEAMAKHLDLTPGEFARAVEKLRKLRLVQVHRTGNTLTYHLDPESIYHDEHSFGFR